jgi:hypothetical protein
MAHARTKPEPGVAKRTREPALLEDGTPATLEDGSPIEIVRTRGGFNICSPTSSYLMLDPATKTKCIEHARWIVQVRQERKAAEAEAAARLEAHIAGRGLVHLDYRTVQIGDLFTVSPYGALREVTHVVHNDNGSTVISTERKRSDPPGSGVALMTPQYPACYGGKRDGS